MPEVPVQSSSQGPRPTPSSDYLFSINRDLKALNASVLVITQKIKYLVRNEKILGRNLIVVNKRVRDMQAGGGDGNSQGGGFSPEAQQLLQSVNERLAKVEARLDQLQATGAKPEDVRELKFLVESLNPLHLVTQQQVEKMLHEKGSK